MEKKKLAVIHIVKKELNLSDAEYRKILKEVAGVESAKELDDLKFRKLMNFFVRSKYYQVNPYGLTIKQKLYIQYLAKEISWEEEHLNNFIHKYYHKDDLNKLTRREAIKVIESLKAIGQHKVRA
ncbi:MAG: hypothetical protein AMJ95_08610 [Omnitrophica WOR_2 bacterium SM23_72]|nr:MAG: hypothetical protein AMJ95_08610 [Omnitrophica WOR_2 bacterium SM23_72]